MHISTYEHTSGIAGAHQLEVQVLISTPIHIYVFCFSHFESFSIQHPCPHLFGNRISLHSLGCSGACCVCQDGLKLKRVNTGLKVFHPNVKQWSLSYIFIFCTWMCCLHECMCTTWMPLQRPEEGVGSPGTEPESSPCNNKYPYQ